MEGTYPVILDEKLVGQLTVSRQGLMTRFHVQCPYREGLIRLSVYGPEHQEGYLGVLIPDGSGGLFLKKELSRRDLEKFPGEIDHCGIAGEHWTEPETEPDTEEEPEAEKMNELLTEEGTDVEEGDVLWRPAAGGALITTHGGQNLVALPADREGLPLGKALEIREIDGIRRAIFPIKNGNLI
jgi:hypothetical protein